MVSIFESVLSSFSLSRGRCFASSRPLLRHTPTRAARDRHGSDEPSLTVARRWMSLDGNGWEGYATRHVRFVIGRRGAVDGRIGRR